MEIEQFIKLIDSKYSIYINRAYFIFYIQKYLDFDYVKIIYALAKGNMESTFIAKSYVIEKLNKIKEYIKHLHINLIASEILSYENYVRYLELKGEDK